MKKALVGLGALLVGDMKVPVVYDLVEVPNRGGTVMEGTVKGDAYSIRLAYITAEHRLQLDGGDVLYVLLLNSSTDGIADVRAIA